MSLLMCTKTSGIYRPGYFVTKKIGSELAIQEGSNNN